VSSNCAIKRRSNLVAAVVLTVCLATTAAARADVLLPPGRTVLWGGQGGDVDAFGRQSGRHPAVFQHFAQFGSLLSYAMESAYGRARPVLHVMPATAPRWIASGAGDGRLLAINRQLSEYGRPVYLRPWSEMNNANNPYSAYDHSGRSRGPDYSTAAFRAAWRRLAIVVRGGPTAKVNRRLHRLGQRGLRTSRRVLPRPQVALLWVPLSFGNPEVPANHPRYWWPGARYVDWVGTTWYSPFPNAGAMDAFYDYPAWNRKPFVFAEFAVWGHEDPGFIHKVFDFAHTHSRVRMLIYFQSTSLSAQFRLSTHPASRAQLRRELRWRRIATLVPEFQ
jgi:hypothetical protein